MSDEDTNCSVRLDTDSDSVYSYAFCWPLCLETDGVRGACVVRAARPVQIWLMRAS